MCDIIEPAFTQLKTAISVKTGGDVPCAIVNVDNIQGADRLFKVATYPAIIYMDETGPHIMPSEYISSPVLGYQFIEDVNARQSERNRMRRGERGQRGEGMAGAGAGPGAALGGGERCER
eukprot:GABW01003096.1.p1 GENE.GABW01003096.1~~GABW01003096.1.p1  ORF type:complete len:120 (-),score=11.36 GABW01003096.1:15-374(-)